MKCNTKKNRFVTCNKGCGREFVLNKNIRRQDMGDSVTRVVIKCPFCGKEYRAFYSSPETTKISKQLKPGISEQRKKALLERSHKLQEELALMYDGVEHR